MQIVAICGDAKYDSLKRDVQPTVYMPAAQNPKWIAAATFEVRSQASPAALAGAIRETVAHIDRGVPVADLRTQEEQIRLSLGLERMFAILVGSFGLLAALLAAIGLYGLMAYSVQRRMPEIGVRLALGAPPAGIRSMILRDSLTPGRYRPRHRSPRRFPGHPRLARRTVRSRALRPGQLRRRQPSHAVGCAGRRLVSGPPSLQSRRHPSPEVRIARTGDSGSVPS